MPLGTAHFADLFRADDLQEGNSDTGDTERRRSSNRMLEEGKRLSWTDMQKNTDLGVKKKKEVFSMRSFLSGGYDRVEDNAEDDGDFDPHTADRKEWELSETDDEEEEIDDRGTIYKCLTESIDRTNKVIEDFLMNPPEERKVGEPDISNYNPDDPTTHPNYYKDPIFHPPDYIWLPYLHLAQKAHRIAISEEFKLFIILVIIIAGINVGVQLYEVETDTFEVLDQIILVIFIFEVIIKIVGEGLRPLRYFNDGWNDFDFAIVVLSLPFLKAIIGGNAQVLRLIRLARMGKLVEKIPPLLRIARGIAKGMASIGYILILMFIVFYLYAIAGYYTFGESDKFHFGEIMHNMLVLYRVATLANWSDLLYINFYGCDVYPNLYVQPEEFTPQNEYKWCEFPEKRPIVSGLYFFTFIIISSFVLLSLFVGTITTNMNSAMEEMKQSMEMKRLDRVKKKKLRKIVRLKSSFGMISQQSFSIGATDSAKSGVESQEGNDSIVLGKILLVTHKASDECANMIEAISAENYTCFVASSAIETMILVKEHIFEVIFVDISIEDAFKIPQQIRHYEVDRKDIFISRNLHKIVHLVMEHTSNETKHQLHIAGTTSFIQKPLTREAFNNYLENPNEFKKDPSTMLSQSDLSMEEKEEESASIGEEIDKMKHWLINLLPAAQAERLQEYQNQRMEDKAQKERLKFAHLMAVGFDIEHEHLAAQEAVKKEEKNPVKRYYLKLCEFCRKTENSELFTNSITITILVAAGMSGAQVDPRLKDNSDAQTTFSILDAMITWIFVVEVIIKLLAKKWRPDRYFKDNWNRFDFIIVVGSFIPGEGGFLVILRLLRLMRILKLARAFPRLAVIVRALLKGASSIGYVGVIMLVFFYVFAILGVMIFGKADPWHYGTLHVALISLFRCATLDGWYEAMLINMIGCDQGVDIYGQFPQLCTDPKPMPLTSVLYFMVFLLISANILLVLFIGVVATTMDEVREQNEVKEILWQELEEMEEDWGITIKQLLAFQSIFHMIDQEGDGLLSMDELETALDMLNLEVTPIQLKRLVNVLDEDGKGIHCANFVRLILMTPKYLELSKGRRALMKLRQDEAILEHRLAKSPLGLFGFLFKWMFATEHSKKVKAAIMVQRAWRRRKENNIFNSLKAYNSSQKMQEQKKETETEEPDNQKEDEGGDVATEETSIFKTMFW